MTKPTSEQNGTRDMELKNRLTVIRREWGGGQWGKEGEGSSQGTCIKGIWTMTMGRRIECWGWVGQGRVMGEKWRQL